MGPELQTSRAFISIIIGRMGTTNTPGRESLFFKSDVKTLIQSSEPGSEWQKLVLVVKICVYFSFK